MDCRIALPSVNSRLHVGCGAAEHRVLPVTVSRLGANMDTTSHTAIAYAERKQSGRFPGHHDRDHYHRAIGERVGTLPCDRYRLTTLLRSQTRENFEFVHITASCNSFW
jgi:hypothetical protein